MTDENIEPCPICEAKDAEIAYMTRHIARLTRMLDDHRQVIAALQYEFSLEDKNRKGTEKCPPETN